MMFQVHYTLSSYVFCVQDEIINLVSTLPHTNGDANILEIRTTDECDSKGEYVANETQQLWQDADAEREDVTTAGGKSRLIIPTLFFKQPKYHPLHIFVSI